MRINQSMRRSAALAVDGLQRAETNLVGIVANDVVAPRHYRYYGGSWQYAASPRRLNGADLLAADELRSGKGRGRIVPDEVLAIDDPDWAASKA